MAGMRSQVDAARHSRSVSAVKLASHLQPPGPALFIAPLLNTVLLLLVFFYLGSSFIVQSGVSVQLPESGSRLTGFERAHVISLPEGPDQLTYYDGRLVTLVELRQILEKVQPGDRRVIVHADQHSSSGHVMEITSIALGLGFEVAHATTPKEEP